MRKTYVFTNIRELRGKAGLSKRVVASRLFPGEGSERRFATYEEGVRSTFQLYPVSLFHWAEALECGVTDLKMEEVPVMKQTIYMIQSKEYYTIHGLWTNLDEMLVWISDQTCSWDTRTGETDLDLFMDQNQLVEYQDGGGHGEHISWKEIIPMD